MTHFVFDFDGVIVDSTIECYEVSSGAYLKFLAGTSEPLPILKKENFNRFCDYRPMVAGATQYLGCWHAVLNNIDILKAGELQRLTNTFSDHDKLRFSNLFYTERTILYEQHPSDWLQLHKPFKWLIPILQKLLLEERLWILSFKDYGSVKKLCDWIGLENTESKIFVRDGQKTKAEQLTLLASQHGVSTEELLFIDDNVTHLVPAKRDGFEVRYPEWARIAAFDVKFASEQGVQKISKSDLLRKVG